MSKPPEQEPINPAKPGKPVEHAPKPKPVKKVHLKNKPTELAKQIKKTVERNKAKPKVAPRASSSSSAAAVPQSDKKPNDINYLKVTFSTPAYHKHIEQTQNGF